MKPFANWSTTEYIYICLLPIGLGHWPHNDWHVMNRIICCDALAPIIYHASFISLIFLPPSRQFIILSPIVLLPVLLFLFPILPSTIFLYIHCKKRLAVFPSPTFFYSVFTLSSYLLNIFYVSYTIF
jgi:hypothetical protein